MMNSITGVIGAGSFGTAVSTLLSTNTDVLVYSRNPEQVNKINEYHTNLGYKLPKNIKATGDLGTLAKECNLIFPVLPAAQFRSVMRELSPHIKPSHILIHGTKGLDIKGIDEADYSKTQVTRHNLLTMSQVIREETAAIRVGCISGPNLAKEIMGGLPTATVLASEFEEVIKLGNQALSSDRFVVFGSPEIRGVELAGALKNIIAIGTGIIGGLQLGKNLESILITRGLREIILFGNAMDVNSTAFLGTAGIGDLIATSTSENSRNYTFGKRLAGGEKTEDIINKMEEVAEGVRTLKIIFQLAKYYRISAPITNILHRIVFEGLEIQAGIHYLMRYPHTPDVDFL
jgi:glycerol-3-phosphate dehydrogenase (NAD(P)+)